MAWAGGGWGDFSCGVGRVCFLLTKNKGKETMQDAETPFMTPKSGLTLLDSLVSFR